MVQTANTSLFPTGTIQVHLLTLTLRGSEERVGSSSVDIQETLVLWMLAQQVPGFSWGTCPSAWTALSPAGEAEIDIPGQAPISHTASNFLLPFGRDKAVYPCGATLWKEMR